MNTNETKVDVLGIVDAAIERKESHSFSIADYQMREARSIIAELIESSAALSSDIEFTINDPRCVKHDRLRAALSRIGGAK